MKKMEKRVIIMISTPFEVTPTNVTSKCCNKIPAENPKVDKAPSDGPSTYISYYTAKLSERMGWKVEDTIEYINKCIEVNPASAFSILLREIALELDKKYEDNIINCKEFFVISLMDGRIHKVSKAAIKNFRNFAAFRTIEDARTACRILRGFLKSMFKSGGK